MLISGMKCVFDGQRMKCGGVPEAGFGHDVAAMFAHCQWAYGQFRCDGLATQTAGDPFEHLPFPGGKGLTEERHWLMPLHTQSFALLAQFVECRGVALERGSEH